MAETKADRFSLAEMHPERRRSNLQDIQKEVTDLIAAIRILNLELVRKGLPPINLNDEEGIARKIEKVAYYAQCSVETGRLAEPLIICPRIVHEER